MNKMASNATYSRFLSFEPPTSSAIFLSIITPMSLLGIFVHSFALYFMITDDDSIVAPIILIALSCVEIANASFNFMSTLEPFYGNVLFRKARRCLTFPRVLHVAIMHLLTSESALKAFYAQCTLFGKCCW